MINKQLLEKLRDLAQKGIDLAKSIGIDEGFVLKYQLWYTEAMEYVKIFCPNRYNEFVDCYSKPTSKGNPISIQKYMLGYTNYGKEVVTVSNAISLQVVILLSIPTLVTSEIAHIKESLFLELNETELSTARKLLKVNIRASGCIAGVVLENHLKSLLRVYFPNDNTKDKDLNISVLNDKLRPIYRDIVWREVQALGTIRNYCDHDKQDENGKTVEPTKDQVSKLIKGTKEFIESHKI